MEWVGYPDSENTLQAEADMDNALDLVRSFWKDVGEDKRPTKQYGPEYDLGMKIRSKPTWRSMYHLWSFGQFILRCIVETHKIVYILRATGCGSRTNRRR